MQNNDLVPTPDISDLFELKKKTSKEYLRKLSKKGEITTKGNFFLCSLLKATFGNYTDLSMVKEQLKQSFDPLLHIYVGHGLEDFGFVVMAMSQKLQDGLYDEKGDRIAWIESWYEPSNEYLRISLRKKAVEELAQSRDAVDFAKKLDELSNYY